MAMIKLLAISLEMNNLMHMVQPFTWVLTENGASFSLKSTCFNFFITLLFTTPYATLGGDADCITWMCEQPFVHPL